MDAGLCQYGGRWRSPDIIAKAMHELDFPQQNAALEDVHGVLDVVDETPQFVDRSLIRLQESLDQIDVKPAYDRACQQNIRFVMDRSFRLAFLRADLFQPRDAARRMVNHFALKLELWGEERLTQHITRRDLTVDERAVIESTSPGLQVLPLRDQSGRAVMLAMHRDIQRLQRPESGEKFSARLLWYFMMLIASEDVQTQKCGYVYIAYGVGHRPDTAINEMNVWMRGSQVANSIPLHLSALHYCYDDDAFIQILDLIILTLNASGKCRCKIIKGEPIECKFKLASFGIPVGVMPLKDNGIESTYKHFERWYTRQQLIEEFPRTYRGKIQLPGLNHVLCERGKPYQTHPGNTRFVRSVIVRHAEYKSLPDGRPRANLVTAILNECKRNGMVFLRLSEDGHGFWEEAPDGKAREKIRNLFKRRVKERLDRHRHRDHAQGREFSSILSVDRRGHDGCCERTTAVGQDGAMMRWTNWQA